MMSYLDSSITKLNPSLYFLNMRLEKVISQDMFKRKSQSLRDEIASLNAEKQIHQNADNNFKNTIAIAFSLASKAYDIFQSSKIAEKHNLIAFMFSNLKLNGENLVFTLKKPLLEFAKLDKFRTWSGWRESNPHG